MRKINTSYKYRLYPTRQQKVLLEKHFGACRLVYNLALETKKYAWDWHKVNLGGYDLVRQITDLKRECSWLKEISNVSLQQSVLDLESAYKGFFKEDAGYPKYKSKNHKKQTFKNITNIILSYKEGVIKFAKFREGIKCVFDRKAEGVVKSIVVSKSESGKYFVSVLTERTADTKIKVNICGGASIGVDLGLKDFIVTSDGARLKAPQYLRKGLERIKVLQQRASRKQKGSKNRKKANLKIALKYEKITNRRRDFLHKLSRQLIDENQGGVICLESLNIEGMIKNHRLALSIGDAGWGEFVRQLKYKGDWYGVKILQIDRFAPSSKTCTCGCVNKELTLNDRLWTCSECGATHDRDLLAANNIKKFALNEYSGRGSSEEPVEVFALAESMKQERLTNYKLKT